MSDVFLVSAVRTPIGRFGGALKDHSAVDLAALAMKAALDRGGVSGDALDFYVFGNVLRAGQGQLIPRQAAIQAGIPNTVDGLQIDMVCSSGMMAVMNAAALVKAGDADLILAGGTESMTNTGFYVGPGARWGFKYLGQPEPFTDLMQRDGLSDPFTGEAMGVQADRDAKENGVARADIDAVAAESHRRAAEAHAKGYFADEIVPVEYRDRKETKTLTVDEGIRAGTTTESLGGLRAAFGKDGTLTAGSSSQISDGASAILVASAEAVQKHGLTPLAKFVGGTWHAGEPWRFPEAPVPAAQKLLNKIGRTVSDFDLFENNEAFALNNVLFTRMLGVDPEALNVHGGAVALGHPIGASGARILTTLVHALRTHDKQAGLAAICHGTGGGTAVAIERV